MRASRLLTSTGVRLAALQTILLVIAFAVAGVLTKLSVMYVYRHEVQARILKEAADLRAIDLRGGDGAAAKAMSLHVGRRRGLEYRLQAPDGRSLGGDLPPTGAGPGWTYLDWDDQVVAGRPFQDLLVFTQRLRDRSVLTVGQDLSAESRLRHFLERMLFWCGAAGAVVGLGLSYLGRGALRRIDGLLTTARAVSAGDMRVRAPVRTALISDDVDELSATFNTMLDEIATLVSRVRWVSTDIAHDLRTPLTHVRQKLERIKRAPGADGEILAAAQEIDRDVDELLRTFDAMLRLAEIENDPRVACQGRIDLAELVGRIVDAYRPDLEASGRRLDVRLQPAMLDADADLIAQAIANLIENALRHTPSDAVIRVCVAQTGDKAVVSVSDNGPGIPLDQRDAVLQRFHRLESSRTTPGSGLGLPIVTAIASRHGATLTLSDAKPGLSASLAFPAADAAA